MFRTLVLLAVLLCARGCRHGDSTECLRIVTVINNEYDLSAQYGPQMASIVCYATRHGHGYDQIDPGDYEECRGYNSFFFAKHCAVTQYLKKRAKRNAWLLVLDGDVAEANKAVPLEVFLEPDVDILFYERSWNPEIMAGNYLVRNTIFSQMFLMQWAAFDRKQPPGFSSADNGALHPQLANALSLPEEHCLQGYFQLNHTVYELDPYFEWVQSCRNAGLRANTILKAHVDNFEGTVFIFEKNKGPVTDGFQLQWKTDQGAGFPPLYHGVKNKNMLFKSNGCWALAKN